MKRPSEMEEAVLVDTCMFSMGSVMLHDGFMHNPVYPYDKGSPILFYP